MILQLRVLNDTTLYPMNDTTLNDTTLYPMNDSLVGSVE